MVSYLRLEEDPLTAKLRVSDTLHLFTHSKMATDTLPYVQVGDTKQGKQTYLPTHEVRIIIHTHMKLQIQVSQS